MPVTFLNFCGYGHIAVCGTWIVHLVPFLTLSLDVPKNYKIAYAYRMFDENNVPFDRFVTVYDAIYIRYANFSKIYAFAYAAHFFAYSLAFHIAYAEDIDNNRAFDWSIRN